MISFQSKFMETNGNPFEYKGKMIRLYDYFKIPYKRTKLKLKFIKTNSEWKQGISIAFRKKGFFYFKKQKIKKGIHLWEHTAPNEVVFEVETKEKEILIYNVWEDEDKFVQTGHNGAALFFEQIENGKRYYCNDGHPDDDFDELIFELTVVNE